MDSKSNTKDSKYIKIRLHVLSPIHIGCDDVYEPTSFVIDEGRKKLIEFDPIDFVRLLNDKQRAEFIKVCSQDSLLAIMKFIKNNSAKVKGREVDIVNHLVSHYKKVLAMSTFDKKVVINQFTMNKTAFNLQTHQPYIPGSSLKGSMRTAYLSALAKVKNIANWTGKADALESRLLDRAEDREKMSSDPFRMVKVSDLLPVGDVKTKIVYAVNKRKKQNENPLLSERGGIYQIFEIIKEGSVFEGLLNIEMPDTLSKIKSPISADNLFLALHKFYTENLKWEITPLNKVIGIKHQAGINANAKFKDRFKKDVFLIRIGRHSGAEAVTIEGNRRIKIMQAAGNPPVYSDNASTLWLASDNPKPENNDGLIPFGWAAIEVL